jgi:hypothetical protein
MGLRPTYADENKFRAVILSEASAAFADAESKDPYTPNPATADRRLSATRGGGVQDDT